MQSYSRPLGDAVKRARAELGFTQNQVAEAADIDVRTVLNIENYKGNPKMEVLFPLVRVLKMDSREIFYSMPSIPAVSLIATVEPSFKTTSKGPTYGTMRLLLGSVAE